MPDFWTQWVLIALGFALGPVATLRFRATGHFGLPIFLLTLATLSAAYGTWIVTLPHPDASCVSVLRRVG